MTYVIIEYGNKGGYVMKRIRLIAMCAIALSVFTFGFIGVQAINIEVNPFFIMDYDAAD